VTLRNKLYRESVSDPRDSQKRYTERTNLNAMNVSLTGTFPLYDGTKTQDWDMRHCEAAGGIPVRNPVSGSIEGADVSRTGIPWASVRLRTMDGPFQEISPREISRRVLRHENDLLPSIDRRGVRWSRKETRELGEFLAVETPFPSIPPVRFFRDDGDSRRVLIVGRLNR